MLRKNAVKYDYLWGRKTIFIFEISGKKIIFTLRFFNAKTRSVNSSHLLTREYVNSYTILYKCTNYIELYSRLSSSKSIFIWQIGFSQHLCWDFIFAQLKMSTELKTRLSKPQNISQQWDRKLLNSEQLHIWMFETITQWWNLKCNHIKPFHSIYIAQLPWMHFKYATHLLYIKINFDRKYTLAQAYQPIN